MEILHYKAALAFTIVRDHMLISVSLFNRNLNVYAKSEKFRPSRDTRDTIDI